MVTYSFSTTDKTADDTFTSQKTGLTEDSVTTLKPTIVYLDVMQNDSGGSKSTLFSLDNGDVLNDLLIADTGRTEALSCDVSANGAHIWITSDGKVGYDASALNAAFTAQLNNLSKDEFLYDT